MDLNLADKTAVVAGASKGIGLAVVRQLAPEGANRVAGARNTEPLTGLESKVDAVVFDLDGVLVDSESVWDAARREVVRAPCRPSSDLRPTGRSPLPPRPIVR
jgi:NAD(P)-dependent dehydrogenase (short-subunit alcohol dehydrogenase family)